MGGKSFKVFNFPNSMVSEVIYTGPGEGFYDIDEFERVLEHRFPNVVIERYDEQPLGGASLKFVIDDLFVAGYYVTKNLGGDSETISWASGDDQTVFNSAMDKIRANLLVGALYDEWENYKESRLESFAR